MRLLCPHCQKGITVPDSDAGKATRCPLCSQSFVAPELFGSLSEIEPYGVEPASKPSPEKTPAVTNPTPIAPVSKLEGEKLAASAVGSSLGSVSGGNSSLENGTLPAPGSASPPPLTPVPAQYADSGAFYSFSIQLKVIQWIPAVGLALALFFSFFSWVGSFPADYPAYTQNGWQAMIGSFTTDKLCEEVYQQTTADIQEKTIKEQINSNFFLLFYFVGLIAAIVLAWAGHLVTQLKLQIPPQFKQIWEYRAESLAGLTALTMLILTMQSALGISLQNGARRVAEKVHEEKLSKAVTPVDQQKVLMAQEAMLASYQIHKTIYFRIILWCHILALLSIGLETLMERRKAKGPPRIGVMW